MEPTALESLTTVFSGMVSDVMDFIVGLLPIVVPLMILGIGIPMGIYYIRKFSKAKG